MKEGVILSLGFPTTPICQETPYLSFSQPYLSLNGHFWSGIKTEELPSESFFQYESTSSGVEQLMMKDTAGLNLKNGPPSKAMNRWPRSSKTPVRTLPPMFGRGPICTS